MNTKESEVFDQYFSATIAGRLGNSDDCIKECFKVAVKMFLLRGTLNSMSEPEFTCYCNTHKIHL
jgi:hypothetical protein